MAVESPHRARVLRDHAQAVGAVGLDGGRAQQNEHGQGQERAAGGDDVQDRSDEAHGREQEIGPGRRIRHGPEDSVGAAH